MITLEEFRELTVPASTKIVLIVMDGLGGLPDSSTGKTELETARTPNLSRLAAEGMCGLHEPVGPGITPGSGPGHLGLFGYDPLKYRIGRGVLEGLGVDFPLQPGDIAARGNFCTIDSHGLITDRRAGRIATEKSSRLCEILGKISIPGVQAMVRPVKEHRFLVVFRGDGLQPDIEDTDPERTGVAPKPARAVRPEAEATASLVNRFIDEARRVLAGQQPANMVLLRGFSCLPDIPTIGSICKVRPAAVVTYPMYKGVARVLGMRVFDGGSSLAEGADVLARIWPDYDYFFFHVKKTDAAGEDGDFTRKVAAIEDVDSVVPKIVALKPDVIAVTGDHSTPATLKGHSWHPVPFLLHSKWCRPSRVAGFGESACASGNLGVFPALAIMPMLMAHALRMTKYGA